MSSQTRRAFFFGAGLSRPSGQPLVHEFMKEILEELGLNVGTIDLLRSTPLPFELFMQTLAERTSISPLLSIFEQGRPNAYHMALAELARRGALQTLITTNFDTLLEQALMENGLRPRSDFLVYDQPSRFARIRWESRKLIIIKLHGSITSKEPLGVTLERVASRASAVGVKRALAPILDGRRCDELYFAGYSFSDAFDVSPVMRSLEPWRVEITHLAHEPGISASARRSLTPPPGLTSPVHRLSGRTEAYFRYLARRHGLTERAQARPGRTTTTSLPRAVKAWRAAMPSAKRQLLYHYTLARLLYRYGRFEAALREVSALLNEARRLSAPRWEAEAYLNAGIFHYRVGHYRDAARHAAKAVRIAQGSRYKRVAANALGNLGNAQYARGRLRSALRWQLRAAEAAKAIGYSGLLANTHGNIGIIHEAAGSFALAVRSHRRAIRIATQIGDALGLARHTSNIALCLNKMGRLADAEAAASRALELARLTTQPHIEAAAYAELARSWTAAKPAEAEEAIAKALAIASEADPGSEPLYLQINADICAKLGRTSEARGLLQAAAALIARSFGPGSKQYAHITSRLRARA